MYENIFWQIELSTHGILFLLVVVVFVVTVIAFKNRVKQCILDNFLFYTDALTTVHVDV